MKGINLKKEFESNQVLLLLMNSVDYNNVIVDNIKKVANKSVCYVTLNKTHESLIELFKKNKVNVNNLVFIDAISATIRRTRSQTDSCYFCSSPGALTELSILINKMLRHNFEYLILDSLNNMLIYRKKGPVAKFISSLVNNLKASNTKAILYAVDMQDQADIIKEVSMFVDKVIVLK
jgi:archaellum biogenesis ATPase FlaH